MAQFFALEAFFRGRLEALAARHEGDAFTTRSTDRESEGWT
jgi:hypothetical protein